ncbi:tyrosine-type recombinase/integrase [Weizmannia sp. FSL W8-0676]|uniref:tyrosine-type recombinase/integrase n=1 Tax=Weizmannia sp. FSL W8-0676 TaxID=2954703 RepID=UPI0031585BFB
MREPKIYETAGGYGFRLDIGTDPVTGKRLQRRFGPYKKKTEARRALSQKQYEISSGRYVDSQDIKLGDFLKRWLDHKSKNVSSGTMANYRPFVMNHLIPNLGNIKMDQLKPGQIQELYDEYVEEETLSNQSIVHMHRILNNAYKKAIEWEIVTKNPCVAVKPPKPEKHRLQVWDETEVQFFLDMAKEDRFYIAYLLALSTGMRKGEILGLRWQDIDFTNQILSVNQAVTRKKGGGHEIGPLKTEKSYRNISLFDYVVTELKKYRHEQMKFKMENRKTYKDQDLVLASSTGSFILPRNLDRNWLDLIEKSALKPIRFHDMRHTHATILLKQGVHPKVVQERLGHSSITVTLDTYSHVLPNIQKAAAEKFGEQIFGNKPDSKHDILG